MKLYFGFIFDQSENFSNSHETLRGWAMVNYEITYESGFPQIVNPDIRRNKVGITDIY